MNGIQDVYFERCAYALVPRTARARCRTLARRCEVAAIADREVVEVELRTIQQKTTWRMVAFAAELPASGGIGVAAAMGWGVTMMGVKSTTPDRPPPKRAPGADLVVVTVPDGVRLSSGLSQFTRLHCPL